MERTTTIARILIAEDEIALSKALETKLSEKGFDVEIASDGEIALQKVQDAHFDLIILDILMPKMNGLKFLEEMLELGIEVPVIVASNLSREDEITEARRLGVVEYFIKSETSLDTIIQMVEAHTRHD
ncbi:response regulator [candidate division WWE3 bacterium]|uniref:Response regulator n=1 Tax=candidate division WWE3 bacterium TaxID=2053526 RepID=A0A955RX28_UNCKA|nr:response regulator [candidate division WWE3 bacterium]